MMKEDIEHYISEISRVLRKRGRCLITYFLINDESLKLMADKTSEMNFIPYRDKSWVINPELPEDAVAYNESFILELYQKYGLIPKQPFLYGSWCKRKKYLSYQDIIIAAKI